MLLISIKKMVHLVQMGGGGSSIIEKHAAFSFLKSCFVLSLSETVHTSHYKIMAFPISFTISTVSTNAHYVW